MPETKDFKSRWKDVLIALKHLFKYSDTVDTAAVNTAPKKILDQATVEQELSNFVKIKGYSANDPNFDIENFQAEFTQYLKEQNYTFEAIDASLIPSEDSKEEDVLKSLKNVRKVTECLNDNVTELSVFVDTTKMMPGLVCYTIEKIAPTQKKPYVTYRPVPRVITQIHDSGVNGGTIFFTYNHRISTSQNFNGATNVVSEDEVVYSPLTKEHADYICKLLNIQSRQVYTKYLKEKAKQEQLKLQNQKTKMIQHTK